MSTTLARKIRRPETIPDAVFTLGLIADQCELESFERQLTVHERMELRERAERYSLLQLAAWSEKG
jgi:hypothetical protein